ncbi:MAG TPA: ferritin [Gemmatimonadales bacterium]|jgi:ferritin
MPFSGTLEKSLNDQISKEFYASYFYLAMAAWFAERNLDGFASWMRVQADEERGHAMRIYQYVLDRGGRVVLGPIEEPPITWKSPLEVFETARKHEQLVSGSINDLYTQALTERDYPSQVMLQWFISEQVEEEKASTAIVERLRLVGDNASGLLILDGQLGQRTKV